MNKMFLNVKDIKLNCIKGQNSASSESDNNILKARKSDVAVVGIACKVAGADNTDQFWDILKSGKECVKELSKQRKNDIYDYLEACELKTTKENVELLDFSSMNEIDKFDCEYFKISPSEAKLMDPRQRMMLEIAWNALEDSGYCGDDIVGSKTGVFVGMSSTKDSYINLLGNIDGELTGKVLTGNLPSIVASRISYILNLKGPAISIDTACSSSLVAIHNAVKSLNTGECDMAIAGGVDITFIPRRKDSYNIGINSPDLKTKTFDDRASGTNSGEAVGAVILKPLYKAKQDNDHIYAIIKGSAINQDGASVGIVAPNMESQQQLILEAWKNAEIDPQKISYIEAHGTATNLGDPIEITAITNAFRKYTDKYQFCGVGSVKTNVGHTNSAAGIVSFIKLLLCLKYGYIPASINFRVPNKNIDFVSSPVYVVDKYRKWEEEYKLCGVSSFGLSGTNCHIVLEEYKENPVVSNKLKGFNLLTITSNNEDGIVRVIDKYLDYLTKYPDVSLTDFCYTANTGRKQQKYRIYLVSDNIENLVKELTKLKQKINNGSFVVFATDEDKELSDKLNKKLSKLTSQVVQKEELEKIGELYEVGAKCDWKQLYKYGNYNKISIPVYPFKKERCWYDIKSTKVYEETLCKVMENILASDNISDLLKEKANNAISEYIASIKKNTENIGIEANIKLLGRTDGKYTATEKSIAQSWYKTFAYNEINIMDNFHDMGLDSLHFSNFYANIREKFTVNLTDIYTYSSIYELAHFVEKNNTDIVQMFNEFNDVYKRRDVLLKEFFSNEMFVDGFKKYDLLNQQYNNINYSNKNEYKNILVTGATGYLGIYLVRELLLQTESNIILLVRASNKDLAYKRISNKIKHFFGEEFFELHCKRLTVVRAYIDKRNMGLTDDEYENYSQIVDCIIHCAAYTSHFGVYNDFYQANVLTTKNLVKFAKYKNKKDFNFISSYGVAESTYKNENNVLFTEYSEVKIENINLVKNYYTKTKIISEDIVSSLKEENIRVNIFRMDNISYN